MKTFLVEGKQLPDFDERLVSGLLSDSAGYPGTGLLLRIGIENDQGEIYRIIEIENRIEKQKLSAVLSSLGFEMAHHETECARDLLKARKAGCAGKDNNFPRSVV
ncbi:hypothetical protein [Noviherbaspirillum humi]|uniref:hypothetical protein n=1 Tax=Noviherbaspirillum humi TaxID=1688639 RepID=UPI0011605412|nr:hypothetical protein [Noviherbaspirillum humi]